MESLRSLLGPGSDVADDRADELSFKSFLQVSGAASLVVTAVLFAGDGRSAMLVVAIGLCMAFALSLGLLRWGFHSLAMHLSLMALLVASVVSVVIDGSVRGAASWLMVGSVIVAALYAPRRSFLVTVVVSVLVLSVLHAAEYLGWLRSAQLQPGLVPWAVHTAFVLVVSSIVYTSKAQTARALAAQAESLALAQEAIAQAQSSQARFHALFWNNPAAVLVHNGLTQVVQDANAEFEKVFGYSVGDVRGNVLPALWADPLEKQKVDMALRAGHCLNDLFIQALRANGAPFEARVSAQHVPIVTGAEPMVIIMVSDVSAERRALRALQTSEDRFSKSFHCSPLPMMITRISDGVFLEFNAANERLLGWSKAECIGRPAQEVGVWIAPQDRMRFITALQQNRRLQGYETRLRKKAGNTVVVRLWSELIHLDGAACALSFVLDVDADKRHEEMLLEVANGVAGATADTFFRSLVEHLAHALQADLVVVGEIETPERVRTVAAWHAGKPTPNLTYDCTHTPCAQIVQGDADTFLVDDLPTQFPNDTFPIGSGFQTYQGVALRAADGRVIGVLKALWKERLAMTPEIQALMKIFSSRCAAELVRINDKQEIDALNSSLEKKVRERTRELRYLNRELDSFAYSVSHDLKAPLRSIDGFLHLLREQALSRLDSSDAELIDRSVAAVARMNGLIADLLLLARVNLEQLQCMNVNLSELALAVIRQQTDREPERQVEVVIEPDCVGHCDPRLAQIVLDNLLGNAWKYTQKTTNARIEFFQMSDRVTGRGSFCVRDNGAGFDMAQADRLFKPFSRLHSAQQFEGTGIGLATVRRIIERHGGQIQVHAQPELGATVWFDFGDAGDPSQTSD